MTQLELKLLKALTFNHHRKRKDPKAFSHLLTSLHWQTLCQERQQPRLLLCNQLGKPPRLENFRCVNHEECSTIAEQWHWVTQIKTPKPITGPWNAGTSWAAEHVVAMMISHKVAWPCMAVQWGHALTDGQWGPPSSAPLTLHLQCFGPFCSPPSLQSSLSQAHLPNKGIAFLGQKAESKPGNISWLLLQDQQSITIPSKANQTTKSPNNPSLSPQTPRMIKQ